MLSKEEFLQPLARLRSDEIVVTTMGMVRPWGQLSDHPLDFASADSAMGHAADLALGLALAQPSRRVVCLNGDGSMLMTLGTLVTVIASGARNLILFVVQNDTYEITGNQLIPGRDSVDFEQLARAAGFARTYSFSDPKDYASRVAELFQGEGPVFAVARVQAGRETPLNRNASVPERYLQVSLAESAHQIRSVLGF